MPKERSQLQCRIAPGVTVGLEYPTEGVTKVFRLAFNNNALASIEDRCGLNLLANPYALWVDLGKSRLGVMFWAALLQDRPELDSDEGLRTARSYLDTPANELRAFNAVWDAYLLYVPKDQAERLSKSRAEWDAEQRGEKKEENPPAPAATEETPAKEGPYPSTGSSSGPSPDSTSDSPIAISAS